MSWLLLGQGRPADTNPLSILTVVRGYEYRVDLIMVCEQAGGTPTYRIFIDDDGTTYDVTTAIVYDVALSANQSFRLEGPFYMGTAAGNLAVRSSVLSQITFSAFGERRKLA